MISSTSPPLSDNRKRDIKDNRDCKIDHMLLDILNKMIQEVLPIKRSKLKTVNCKCKEINNKLLLKDQEKLEHCNFILGNRVT